MTIEFDGTGYKGWQVQPEEKSVQNEIEKCIMVITKSRINVHSSGRTDAGVHAKKMTANFFIDKELDLHKFKKSLNALLPDDIAVIELEYADDAFHSRKSAKKKIYEYHILNRETKSPFLKKYCWHVKKPLDIAKMEAASKRLIGEHDFTGFTSVGTDVASHVRTVYDITIEKEGDIIVITFTGSGFLKQMVRNIAGLLVQIGYGKFSESSVNIILEGKQISKRYITAPARGLFLKDVLYG
jgi:tRNA pseudouridine38-40 synthase